MAPSARNQLVDVAVTPALSCPAPKNRPPLFKYIARSTMIGTSEVILAETSVAPVRDVEIHPDVERLFG